MKFESFEQALKICLTAEEKSPEQVEAMIFCLENAPPDLQEILAKRFKTRPGEGCGCKGN